MSSGPAPSISTTKLYFVQQTPGTSRYTVNSGLDFNYTITDVPDGSSDNTAVLEASGRDTIQLTGPNSASSGQGIYLGNTSNPGDIFVFSNGQTTLLSNNSYQNGTVLNIQTGSTPLCFCDGTLIRTVRGDVAVEQLRTGDVVVTASGGRRPIQWIGSRRLCGGSHGLQHDQQPIRIRAGAFGPGLPARDLRLSSGHPVLVGADADGAGGHLVPIMCLINGTSIVREPASAVTYWHVELDAHDVLLAEGLPAESYYDMGCRPWFAGEDGPLLNPDFVTAEAPGRCRPVAVDGSVVEAERVRLSGVFAASLGEACAWDEAGRFGWIAA